jgi:hypothetical protein
MILIPPSHYQVKKTKLKGRGVFARKEMEPGIAVGDYLGRILTNKEAENKNGLMGLFRSEREVIWPADIKAVGAHVFNHSCVANCCFYPFHGHMIVVTLRKIFPGEEMTVDYMMDQPTDNKNTKFYPCSCLSKFCRGTMYTTLNRSKRYTYEFLYKKQGAFIKKMIVPFGEILPKLPKYPEHVKDHPIYNLFGSSVKKPFISQLKKIPSVKELRSTIRETGRYVKFPRLGLTVLGVIEGKMVIGK